LLALSIDEASAKVRTGPPVDDDEDMDLDIWAGVIPLSVTAGDPIPAPDLKAGIEVAASAADYARQTPDDR
jgi:hypothetical protein